MGRLVTLALSLAAAASPVLGAGEAPNNASIPCAGQDMYLVEINREASLDEVLKPVEASMNITRCKTMDFSLFKGASIQVGHQVNKTAVLVRLEKTAGVKGVSVVAMNQGPEVEEQGPAVDVLEEGGAMQKRSSTSQTTPMTNHGTHTLTQVDMLHEKGYTGKGVRLAVIDSGVDYTHPALGGCFGPGCLISFGADLIGDREVPAGQQPKLADTPMDCVGHGTAVTGVIAAQRANNTLGFGGVAPGVTLGMYRVQGCNHQFTSDALIQAVYQAHDDKADIISISMGFRNGWAGDAMAEAVSRVVSEGVHVVVAAGNDGSKGLFSMVSPATARGAVAVANMVGPVLPELKWRSTYSIDGGNEVEFEHQVGPLGDWGRHLSYNLYSPNACNLISSIPQKSIVFVRDDGDCALSKKTAAVERVDGKYMIVANNQTALESNRRLTRSAVSAGLGDTWTQALKEGKNVTIRIQVVGLTDSPNSAAGAVAKSSSWGADWELNMKPQLGAPGANVLMTRLGGGFFVGSGTSFAAPLVAGVMALMTEARGKLEPAVMQSLLSTTARPQRFHDAARFLDGLAPTAQQGGGLIQAYAALGARTLMTPSSISFNDTSQGRSTPPSHTLTMENTGEDAVTYSLSYTPALTVYATKASSLAPAKFPDDVETVEASATLQLSQDSVTVAAGQAASIVITASPPTGLDASRLPLWSGWITVNGTDGSSLTVPYQGLAASLREHTVLRNEHVKVATQFSPPHHPLAGPNEMFRFWAKGKTNRGPVLVVQPPLGVPQLNLRLVRLDKTTLSPEKLDQLPGLPARWLPGNKEYAYTWDGNLADGSLAPEGMYLFQVEALRIFGDASNETDWDRVMTERFEIEHMLDEY